MRIIFFGTPDYTIQYLELLSSLCEIAAIITAPDAPAGRGRKPKAPEPAIWAQNRDIPCFQPQSLTASELHEKILALRPDAGIVIAYGKIIPEAVFSIPRHGCFNLHFSLLPKFRGASPVESALMCGETQSGVTIQRITSQLDAGDILCQKIISIEESDHYPEFFDKLLAAGHDALGQTVALLKQGQYTLRPQNMEEITTCRKIETASRKIPWERSATDVFGIIRAFSGHRTAYTSHQGSRILVYRAAPDCRETAEKPGTIIQADKHSLMVACGEGAVGILELQPAGRKKMPFKAFLNGYQLIPGDVFE